MSKYDYKLAKEFIMQNKEVIKEASLGMAEDWFWTAETVYEDGKFLIDLDKNNINTAGINGSHWATPSLMVEFKDGSEVMYACYEGQPQTSKPPFMGHGIFSTPFQDVVDGIEKQSLKSVNGD